MRTGGEAPREFSLAYLAIAVAGVLVLAAERRAAKKIREAREAKHEPLRMRVELQEREREIGELNFELDGPLEPYDPVEADGLVDVGSKTATPASGKTALEEPAEADRGILKGELLE